MLDRAGPRSVPVRWPDLADHQVEQAERLAPELGVQPFCLWRRDVVQIVHQHRRVDDDHGDQRARLRARRLLSRSRATSPSRAGAGTRLTTSLDQKLQSSLDDRAFGSLAGSPHGFTDQVVVDLDVRPHHEPPCDRPIVCISQRWQYIVADPLNSLPARGQRIKPQAITPDVATLLVSLQQAPNGQIDLRCDHSKTAGPWILEFEVCVPENAAFGR